MPGTALDADGRPSKQVPALGTAATALSLRPELPPKATWCTAAAPLLPCPCSALLSLVPQQAHLCQLLPRGEAHAVAHSVSGFVHSTDTFRVRQHRRGSQYLAAFS